MGKITATALGNVKISNLRYNGVAYTIFAGNYQVTGIFFPDSFHGCLGHFAVHIRGRDPMGNADHSYPAAWRAHSGGRQAWL